LGRDKTVWQRLLGHKSAWISHIDEQVEHRVAAEGHGTIHGGLASIIFGAEYVLTQPGTRCGLLRGEVAKATDR
jgi:hypothetical protein